MKNNWITFTYSLRLMLILLSMGLSTQSGYAGTMATSPYSSQYTFGFFQAYQGQSQMLYIGTLIGNQYIVDKKKDESVLFGLGLFKKMWLDMDIGINTFYLAKTRTSGTIYQEKLFSNLSYQFESQHLPILAMAKKSFMIANNLTITIDGAVGPNIMQVKNYKEQSLDGGITIPDDAFTSKTKAVLAASAGINFLLFKASQGWPIEVGYRFFYLGKGELRPTNPMILNTIGTNNVYAHSITLTATV